MEKPVLPSLRRRRRHEECNDHFGRRETNACCAEERRVLRNTFRESDGVLARVGRRVRDPRSRERPGGVRRAGARLTANIESENAAEPQELPISLSVGLAYSGPPRAAQLEGK